MNRYSLRPASGVPRVQSLTTPATALANPGPSTGYGLPSADASCDPYLVVTHVIIVGNASVQLSFLGIDGGETEAVTLGASSSTTLTLSGVSILRFRSVTVNATVNVISVAQVLDVETTSQVPMVPLVTEPEVIGAHP